MVSIDRINQYKKWFDNLSFFGGNTFVLDAIDDLWKLINYLGSTFSPVNKEISLKDINYSVISKEDAIKLAQQFFDIHNINLNIESLIENNTLILKENEEKKYNEFFILEKVERIIMIKMVKSV